ncbi:uncharacterized protein LOC117103861 [Anneissia japonica]|uniref:uncharacterized protein LOC117103861 n=1 Tax=Anneissia japonica TaxID=1529436 RepID=UPI0014255860|nr:uncharacterized protein LOC117103861 [Anneissia japonica]
MEESEARKKGLKNHRRSKKALMTRSLNMLSTQLKEDDADLEIVTELLAKSEEAFSEVEKAHQQLGELLDDDEFEIEEQWMESSQEAFWKVKNLAKKFITKNKPVKETTQVSNVTTTSSDSLNSLDELKLALELPKAEVLEFNGNPVNYWTFVNNFKTNVASKLSNDNTKLQYLLQLCKDKARTCIESCPLMESGGYDKALEILRKQFGQPHIILSALMSDMLNRKKINIGDGGALWSLVSVMKKCHVTLTQMGYTSDLNSTSNLLKVQSLLPTVLQNKWANVAHTILDDREPTFLDMLTFIEKQAEVSCNMFGRSVGKPASVSNVFRESERPKIRTNVVKTTKGLSCFSCGEDHRIYSCKNFYDMCYDDKLKTVKSKRLCFRCLMPGHMVSKCRREVECRSCNSNKHHELLHPPTTKPDHVKSCAAVSGRNVYLMTVPVEVTSSDGNTVRTLALLDNGSDASLCSESLRKKLGASGKRVRYTATTVNGDEDKVGISFDVKVSGVREESELSLKVLTVKKVPADKDSIPRPEDLLYVPGTISRTYQYISPLI